MLSMRTSCAFLYKLINNLIIFFLPKNNSCVIFTLSLVQFISLWVNNCLSLISKLDRVSDQCNLGFDGFLEVVDAACEVSYLVTQSFLLGREVSKSLVPNFKVILLAGDISSLGSSDFVTEFFDQKTDAINSYWVISTSSQLGKCLDQWEVWKIGSNIGLKLLSNGIEAAQLNEHRVSSLDWLQERDGFITSFDTQSVLCLSCVEQFNFFVNKSNLISDLLLCVTVIRFSGTKFSLKATKCGSVFSQRFGGFLNDWLILIELILVCGDEGTIDTCLCRPTALIPVIFSNYMFLYTSKSCLQFIHSITNCKVELHQIENSLAECILMDLGEG